MQTVLKNDSKDKKKNVIEHLTGANGDSCPKSKTIIGTDAVPVTLPSNCICNPGTELKNLQGETLSVSGGIGTFYCQ
jgi:hypothetical protein